MNNGDDVTEHMDYIYVDLEFLCKTVKVKSWSQEEFNHLHGTFIRYDQIDDFIECVKYVEDNGFPDGWIERLRNLSHFDNFKLKYYIPLLWIRHYIHERYIPLGHDEDELRECESHLAGLFLEHCNSLTDVINELNYRLIFDKLIEDA